MAEYIEREALMEHLEKRRAYRFKEKGGYDNYSNGFYEAVDKVKYFPAADVVKVVRCGECKHGEVDDPDNFPDFYYCHEGCGWNDADFYCKSGERRDGND